VTKQVPWLRVFVEGVVIVGSILLAFGIDAAWEGRQEVEEEREILMGLEAEFVDLHTRLVNLAAFNRFGVRAVEQLLSDSLPKLDADYVDRALGVATIVNVLDQGGALDALLASGRLELIRDRDLRDRLAKWPDWLEDIHTNDLSARDFAVREITPVLARRGWPDLMCYREEQCLPPGPASVAQISIARDPQIRALLIRRRGWMLSAAADHSERAAEAEALLEMIRDQISP